MDQSHVIGQRQGDEGIAEVSESKLGHLRSNILLRRNKWSAVYTLPVSSIDLRSSELHVFEPLDQTQNWFFERVMWPKLRKCPMLDIEFTCGKHHCFIFHQEYLDEATEDEGRSGTVLIAKRLFQQYLKSEDAQLLHNEPIPRKFRSKAAVPGLTTAVPNNNIQEGDAETTPEKLPRRRRRPRALPRDRDEVMIMNWARMLAQEVDLDISKGVSQPGDKFLLQMTQPQGAPPIYDHDTLQMMTQKQGIWAERLSRMVNQLPEALQKQRDLRDQAWLEGLPWIQRWFGNDGTSITEHKAGVSDNDELCQSFHQWGKAMRWMTDWSFDMFEGKLGPSYGPDDWLQCITSNVAIHQWSLDEEKKQLGQTSGPDAILVRMVKTQTRWEITRGMEPLLAQMHEAAETEAREWNSLCQRPATKEDAP